MQALSINLHTATFEIFMTSEENEMVLVNIIDTLNDEAHMFTISERTAKPFMLDVFNNGAVAVEDLLVNQEEYM